MRDQHSSNERLINLIYRDYHPGDEDQIVSLMSTHWKHIQHASDWLHEYAHSPDGAFDSRVCEADGQIVGHYGLILMRLSVAGQTILGAKGEGSVVKSEYRKTSPLLSHLPPEDRSISVRLMREALGKAITEGVRVMWGFTYKVLLNNHLKAGWSFFPVRSRGLIRPLSVTGTARLIARGFLKRRSMATFIAWLAVLLLWLPIKSYRTLKQPEHLQMVSVSEFDDRIDHFWQSLIDRYPMISIDRTHRHLNWRFAHEPYVRFLCLSGDQVTGFAIGLLKDEKGILEFRLVDLVIDDSVFPFIGEVLGGLSNAAGLPKIDLMSAQSYEGCQYQRRLNHELNKYFITSSRWTTMTSVLKVDPLLYAKDYLQNSENWFINDLFLEMF